MKDKIQYLQDVISCTVERGRPMIRIIICDDDENFLIRLQYAITDTLHRMDIAAKIHIYTCAEKIGDPILSSCDIAFLDVDFANSQYNGLDIARKLRSVRKDSIIIFVTNFIEYAPDGYEVQAFRYMLKLDIEQKLQEYLRLAITQLHSISETLKIKINGEIIDIPLNAVLYIESQLRMVMIHVQRGENSMNAKTYSCYATLSDLETQLESKGFLRIHKSYLVNMAHLKRFQCKEAVLDNGATLRVSEQNYAQQKKKYLFWKGMS